MLREKNVELGLRGKTAIVTGASTGLGRAIAKGLTAEGVHVAAVARREELLSSLADEVRASAGHGRLIPIVQDLMDENAAAHLQGLVEAALGPVDIVVNNAGASAAADIATPEEVWTRAMALNFVRPRQIAHSFLPGMIDRKWGRIINISGKSEPESLNATTPAKAALHAWSKALSRDVGTHGITVNCIPPGRIMSEQILRNYSPEYREHFANAEIPVGYWGEPEDLSVLVTFLASPLARYITGTVMPVDGGLRRYQF
jgi:3-oxoacyl-[acyl-carrier protein] reductase